MKPILIQIYCAIYDFKLSNLKVNELSAKVIKYTK